MDSSSEETLKQMRLLVALGKLSNRQALEKLRKHIESDPVTVRIFELCKADCPYASLQKELVDSKQTLARTLDRRLSELTDLGVLSQTKRGVYARSGMLD